jgi:hypothetical protein
MSRRTDAEREGTAEGFAIVFSLKHVPNRLHKLVLPLLLICPPVWAAKLPVPPIPPNRPSLARAPKFSQKLPVPPVPPPGASQTKVAQLPHRASHAATQAVWSRRIPIPPFPIASTPLTSPAPVPDRDAQPPPAPLPHTAVTPTDFRSPNVYTGAAYPYGSQYPTPEDKTPLGTPGFTVTIPLRLP